MIFEVVPNSSILYGLRSTAQNRQDEAAQCQPDSAAHTGEKRIGFYPWQFACTVAGSARAESGSTVQTTRQYQCAATAYGETVSERTREAISTHEGITGEHPTWGCSFRSGVSQQPQP